MGTVEDAGANAAMVALTGRVPVKVSDENGPIYAGDYLTTSSIPGVAMKATKAGQVIGQAMTWFEGDLTTEEAEQGMIVAFIKLDFYNGSKMEDLLPGLSEGGELVPVDEMSSRSLIRLVEEAPELIESASLSEMATDRLVAGLEIITPRLIADEIAVNTIMPATGTEVAMALSGEEKFVVETITPASEDGTIPEITNTVITFDALGNATFAGTVSAQEIDAQTIRGLDIYVDRIATLSDAVAGLEADTGEVTATDLASVRDLIALVSSNVTNATAETNNTLVARIDDEVAKQLTINETVTAGITALETRTQAAETTLATQGTTITELQTRLSALEEKQLLDLTSLNLNSDLTVTGLSTFGGGVQVDSISSINDVVSFMSNLVLIGRPYFNDDTAGFAMIRTGETEVRVNFTDAYLEQPVVQASVTFEEGTASADETSEAKLAREQMLAAAETSFLSGTTKFIVTQKSKEGFTILLNQPAAQDLRFSWIALAVKNAKTFSSIPETPVVEEPPVVIPPVVEPIIEEPVVTEIIEEIVPTEITEEVTTPVESPIVEEPPEISIETPVETPTEVVSDSSTTTESVPVPDPIPETSSITSPESIPTTTTESVPTSSESSETPL
jgi:hypothetical protein